MFTAILKAYDEKLEKIGNKKNINQKQRKFDIDLIEKKKKKGSCLIVYFSLNSFLVNRIRDAK